MAKVLSTITRAPARVRQIGDGRDVGDVQQRVGRGLDPDREGLPRAGWPPPPPPGRSASAGSTCSPQLVVRPGEQPEGCPRTRRWAATKWPPGRPIVRSSVSSAASPLAKAKPRRAALERGQALLERGAGRIGRARVLVAAAGAARPRPGRRSRWRRSAAPPTRWPDPAPGRRGWPGWRTHGVGHLIRAAIHDGNRLTSAGVLVPDVNRNQCKERLKRCCSPVTKVTMVEPDRALRGRDRTVLA